MSCLFCGEEIEGKFCNNVHAMKYKKGERYVPDSTPSPEAPLVPVEPIKEIPKGESTWEDLYEQCQGCDGVNCKSGFVPNWVRMGKTKESLLKEKKSIIKKR